MTRALSSISVARFAPRNGNSLHQPHYQCADTGEALTSNTFLSALLRVHERNAARKDLQRHGKITRKLGSVENV